jgi:pyrroline-5-carboxylate reductase
MPNTPSMVKSGATGLYKNENVTKQQQLNVATMMGSVGTVHWLETEDMLDSLMSVSGSGPAYFFLVVEVRHTGVRRRGAACSFQC